jgi:putative spermidine/putrescine transport system permease protein
MFEDRTFRTAVDVLGWCGVGFLLLPVLVTMLVSFNASPFIEVPPSSYSLAWYANVANINKIVAATLTSLGVALVAGVLATLLALGAALALVRTSLPGKALVTSFLLSPLTVPLVAIGIALIQFFIRIDIAFTWASLIIGHMVLVVAYPVRTIVASLSLQKPSIEEAAAALGAPPFTVFRTITIPQIMPGLVSGFLFAFLVSFDNYPISIFLVRGGLTTMPIEVFNYMSQQLDPTPAAFSTIYVLLVGALVWFVERRYRIISLSVGR